MREDTMELKMQIQHLELYMWLIRYLFVVIGSFYKYTMVDKSIKCLQLWIIWFRRPV